MYRLRTAETFFFGRGFVDGHDCVAERFSGIDLVARRAVGIIGGGVILRAALFKRSNKRAIFERGPFISLNGDVTVVRSVGRSVGRSGICKM